jgi:hypothetical protein
MSPPSLGSRNQRESRCIDIAGLSFETADCTCICNVFSQTKDAINLKYYVLSLGCSQTAHYLRWKGEYIDLQKNGLVMNTYKIL